MREREREGERERGKKLNNADIDSIVSG